MSMYNMKILLAIQLICYFHCGISQYDDSNCVRTYHDLEKSLLSNSLNIDSLFSTFFKVNRGHPQVVTVHYYFKDSSPCFDTQHPLEITDNQTKPRSDLIFNWVESPILILENPRILMSMSLYTFIFDQDLFETHLLLDNICDDEDSETSDLKLELLSQLTSWLQFYALQREGVDMTSYQAVKGYSSYNFSQYWQRYTNCCVNEYDILLLENFNKNNCNCSIQSPDLCPATNLTNLNGCNVDQLWITKECKNSFSDFIAYPQNIASTYFVYKIMIYVSIACLSLFLLLLLPYVMFQSYDGYYDKCKQINEDDEAQPDFEFRSFIKIFVIWSVAGLCSGMIVFDMILQLFTLGDYVMGGIYGGRKRSLYWVMYWCAYALVGVIMIFYCVFVGITVYIKRKQDFPVPKIIQILLCCFYVKTSEDSKRSNSAFQFFLVLPILVMIQIFAIHAIFIFLALIASPVRVVSTIIAYCTGAALAVIALANLMSTLEPSNPNDSWTSIMNRKRICRIMGTTIAFFLLLFFVILFSIAYLQISLTLGNFDQEGLSGLFAALIPSVLFAGIAWMTDKVFRQYEEEKKEERKVEATRNSNWSLSQAMRQQIDSLRRRSSKSKSKSYPGSTSNQTQELEEIVELNP